MDIFAHTNLVIGSDQLPDRKNYAAVMLRRRNLAYAVIWRFFGDLHIMYM
jgi:hypothetical protein